MRQELDEKLCKDYPKIFANRNGDMTTTAMCWGFECSDGWYPLIDMLCREIQWHIDKNAKAGTPQFVASQVKEKFGGLRFYGDGGDDKIHNFIWFAESMSTITCETCGAPGKRRGRGWIYTACDAHTEELDLIDETEVKENE
jgi:hypothetical protein